MDGIGMDWRSANSCKTTACKEESVITRTVDGVYRTPVSEVPKAGQQRGATSHQPTNNLCVRCAAKLDAVGVEATSQADGGMAAQMCKHCREPKKEKGNRSKSVNATAADLFAKLEQQGFRCALSGMELTPATCELDHIEPKARGGTDDADNMQWLHATVNRAKGAMGMDEFIEMCCKVADCSRRKSLNERVL